MVIGYGNVLRGDDAVGPAVIEVLQARAPAMRAIAVPVLMPELAPMLADAPVVIFVDARVDGGPGSVRCEAIAAVPPGGAFGHVLSPSGLLALARELYGCSARGFQVSVGGRNFEVGAAMSDPVAAAVPKAAQEVLEIWEAFTGGHSEGRAISESDVPGPRGTATTRPSLP